MAGGKIFIEDSIMSPRAELTIEYSGHNPFLICLIARDLIRDILKVDGSKMREDDIRWDKSDPNSRWFYGVWRGQKEEDNWTMYWFRISAEGSYSIKDNTGSVFIQLRGHMYTTFEYSNPISLAFWQMFNYLFYWNQRRKYLEWSKDLMLEFKEKIQAAYGILPDLTDDSGPKPE